MDYDSDEWRHALKAKGILPCIPPIPSRKPPVDFDKDIYKQCHKVEITFTQLKDWRRIATRYDRCADLFLSAINNRCFHHLVRLISPQPRSRTHKYVAKSFYT